MRKFDDIIKDKLSSYEGSFDEQAWTKLESKLDKPSQSNTFNNALIAGIAASVILMTLFVSMPDVKSDSETLSASSKISLDENHDASEATLTNTSASAPDEYLPQEIHIIELSREETSINQANLSIKTSAKAQQIEEPQTSNSTSPKPKNTKQPSSNIADLAEADFTAKGIQCSNHDIRFNASLDHTARVTWVFDGIYVVEGLAASHSFSEAGDHETMMIATFEDNSQLKIKRNIHVFEKPTAEFFFEAKSSENCFKAPVAFSATPSNNAYKWLINGDTVGKGQSIETKLANGNYTIGLLMINEAGCLNFENHSVEVVAGFELKVPNSFTDNADGLNDQWEVIGLENTKSFKVVITRMQTNRAVFESTDRGVWDGSINGTAERPLKGEKFTYTITTTDKCDNAIQKRGVINYSPIR